MSVKTNAMRMLDRAKIKYELKPFPEGEKAYKYLGLPENQIYKTLVTTNTQGKYFVFVLPSSEELDLKKAASLTGCKRIEMLKQKDLLPLTGYVHGGCSPVGMKKLFPTIIDESARNWDTIVCSAGKVGNLMAINPEDLSQLISAKFFSIIKK